MGKWIRALLFSAALAPTVGSAHGRDHRDDGYGQRSIVESGIYQMSSGNCFKAVRIRSNAAYVQLTFLASGYTRDYLCETPDRCYDQESETTLRIKSPFSFVIAGSWDGVTCAYRLR